VPTPEALILSVTKMIRKSLLAGKNIYRKKERKNEGKIKTKILKEIKLMMFQNHNQFSKFYSVVTLWKKINNEYKAYNDIWTSTKPNSDFKSPFDK